MWKDRPSELVVYETVSQMIADDREDKLVPYIREKAKEGSLVAKFIKPYGKSQMVRGFFSLPFIEQLIYEYLRERLSSDKLLQDLKPGNSYNKWEWSYLVEACLVAYRRTKNERFLDLIHNSIVHAVSHRDSERGLTDDIRGRVLMSWGMCGHVPNTWTNVITAAGRIVTPILDYMEICEGLERPFPAFWGQVCCDAVNEYIEEFRVSDDGDEGIFNRPTRGDVEPLNHSVSMGRSLLRLGRRYPDGPYERMARQLATFFKRSLFEEEGAYVWGYRPTFDDRLSGFPTTFWKADVDIAFVRDCVDAGLVFDVQDLERFQMTLTRGVLRPGWTNCFVSRSKLEVLDRKAEKIGARCYGLCGWMVVSIWDNDDIEQLLEDAIFANRQHLPGGWLGCGRAAVAYTSKQ